jgi:hypothetical protein
MDNTYTTGETTHVKSQWSTPWNSETLAHAPATATTISWMIVQQPPF